MKTLIVSRRQFLRGSGGFSLGLPFLPSLVPVPAYAADVVAAKQKRFVAIMTDHGAVFQSNMFPPDSMAPNKMSLFPGFDMAYGPLAPSTDGGNTSLAPVLTAPSTALTAKLVSKLNVIEGLCIPFYIAHNTGGHLGNYARNDGNGKGGQYAQKFPTVTIDQLMAYSSSFYTSLQGVRERVLVTGSRGGYSWSWSNPTAKSGTIQEVSTEQSPQALFDKAIGTPMAMTPGMPQPPPRQPIVDRVLAGYKTLRESNRRLSADDRRRLDDHMSRLAELQRRVAVVSPPMPSASCGSVKKPGPVDTNSGDPSALKARFQALNDVIVAAFLCGSSRLATMSVATPLVSYSGSWHQDTAHQWPNADAQQRLLGHNRNVFEWVFVDLARKLDAVDEGGSTVLDNTLIAWSQESGMSTHDNPNMPLITAGSAGGFLKTGLFLDYRCKTAGQLFPYVKMPSLLYFGLTWNQWLATVLQAMGVPKSEFDAGKGLAGYPNTLDLRDAGLEPFGLTPGAYTSANDVLPLLGA
jgi:hypothetical protein